MWLKNNHEPMNIVVDKWNSTRNYRYKEIMTCKEELYYFKEFPSISDGQGYQLVSKTLYVLINLKNIYV